MSLAGLQPEQVMKDAAALSADDILAMLLDASRRGDSWQSSFGIVQCAGPSVPVVILDMQSGASMFIAPDTARRLADRIRVPARFANAWAIARELVEDAGRAEATARLHDTLSHRPAKEP